MQIVLNPSLKVRLLGSNVIANLAMSKHSLENMATLRASAPLFNTRLHQRTAYVEAMLTGDSVHYFGSAAKPAISEIENLFDEVAAVLDLKVTKVKAKK